jgi:hypothetical protein
MTKKEMCVALAKDAIKHVKTEKFSVAKGGYCIVEYEEDGVFVYNRSVPGYLQLDTVLDKPKATCRICALGGLLAMYALRKDDTTIDQACDRSEIVKRLGKYFAKHELDLIETTFEGVKGGPCGIERFIAIMRNIVRNEGTFELPGLKK